MQFECPVVRIEKLDPVPKSDALDITTVFETPVIVRRGQLKVGDLAVYIPEQAMVPMTKPQFQGLGIKTEKEIYRVKAVRLRGTYSEGLLVPIPHLTLTGGIGYDMATDWGITKYEEPETPLAIQGTKGAQQAPELLWAPKYSVESILKNRDAVPDGTMVQVTEKIHGCNARFVHDGTQLHVGSHNVWKKALYSDKPWVRKLKAWVNKIHKVFPDPEPKNDDVWWQTAKDLSLARKLALRPKWVFYGEVFGKVQDLKYGVEGTSFRVFDIYDADEKRWLMPNEVLTQCTLLVLEHVPVLYEGPYSKEAVDGLRTGKSTLHDGTIREGIVIKLLDNKGRNSALKYVSEAYKLRKDGSEFK
jgi:RNA ligase (TIGR02306 family)